MTNTATVTSHEILTRSTPVFSGVDGRSHNPVGLVPSAVTPEDALRHLDKLSPDVRAAVLLDGRGELAAAEPADRGLGQDLRELLLELLEFADAADEEPVAEIEVTGPAGAVFAVRAGDFTLAAVADPSTLSSLVRYDIRRVLADLERG